jgi:hypothetical protein
MYTYAQFWLFLKEFIERKERAPAAVCHLLLMRSYRSAAGKSIRPALL